MYECVVAAGMSPKIFAGPTVYSQSYGYLSSGQKFNALQVKEDVVDSKRPGRQVWLEREGGRWTFAEYPRTNGSPEVFVNYKLIESDPPPPPDSEMKAFTLVVDGFKPYNGELEKA